MVPRPGAMLGLLTVALGAVAAFGAAGPGKPAGSTGKQIRAVAPSPPRSVKAAPGKAAPPPALKSRANILSLVWTGDQNGHLEPCGCAKPQLGGMLRRAGFLQSL